MQIIKFTAENFKRLKVVEITPDGALVPISGRNGQGKTSVLDAIWYAIVGPKAVESDPINDQSGLTVARVTLDLGEIIVTRTFKKSPDGARFSSLTVETADGTKVGSPQSLLDSLIGKLSLDPLAFDRMSEREQYDVLKRFVVGVDFEMMDLENKADYDARTDLNRRSKEAKTVAEKIIIPANAALVRIQEEALLEKLKGIAEHNDNVSMRSRNREIMAKRRDDKFAAADAKTAEAIALQDRINLLLTEAETLKREAAEDRDKLLAAAPLPELHSTDDVMKEIESAKETNRQVAAREERESYLASAADLDKQSVALTTRMEERERVKRDAIAAAKLPVPGLGIGAGVVTLNNRPFKAASGAERLIASCGIAMASDPKLKIIRIRDASLLDDINTALVGRIADEHGYQVWMEVVDGSGKVGFVLEDGQIVHRPGDEERLHSATNVSPTPPAAPKPAAVKPSTPPTPTPRTYRDDVI